MESPVSAANSTSKVKVEYTDPSGVFPLIASDLQARLPLRNLNWNSPGRPIRSIESLYVELYPDEKTSAAQLPKRSTSLAGSAGQSGQDRPLTPTSNDFRRQSETQGPKRERRHQIPGLRQTPYLKLYLLRCDDAEVYKASARKSLREWIKANTPPSQSSVTTSNQENHDAFEWMIIHVVLPDPQATAAWPSKTSANVLDKIRSDFNNSSKSASDHVAQIPAAKDLQAQRVTVSGMPTGPARESFLQESSRAWDDLIGKFKGSILSSFDLRVRQYEEDIKEKGSQRNLPGWNFCTFFVLKEGLARGFESVGLVDDALVGYDELSAELLSVLHEEASKASMGEDTRLFREHTQELLIQAEAALQGQEASSTRPHYKRLSNSVLDTNKKSYRELILSNNISAFDFRTYVFARQISLLLRFADRTAVREAPLSTGDNSSRDNLVLADVCHRAISFIADIARTIRQDLKASFKADSGANESALAARHTVTENLIASYTFATAKQILAKTQDPFLPSLPVLDLCEEEGDDYEEDDTNSISPTSGPNENAVDNDSIPESHPEDTVLPQSSGSGFSYEKASSEAKRSQIPPQTLQLAAERAELFLIARRALSAVATRQGWPTQWHVAIDSGREEEQLDTVTFKTKADLDQETSESQTESLSSQLAGVLNNSMRTSLQTEKGFWQTYEALSLAAFKLFHLADDRKAASTITTDIAALHCRLKDYSVAADYLRELSIFYARNDWAQLEAMILDMYSFCLKQLGKTEEYVRVASRMLGRLVLSREAGHGRAVAFAARGGVEVITRMSIRALAEESKSLKAPISMDMGDYFWNIDIKPFVQHNEEDDGFKLTLAFDYLLMDAFTAQEVRIQIVGISEGQAREIWLASNRAVEIEPGHCTMEVSCRTMIPGWYTVKQISLEAHKVHFQFKYHSTDGLPADKDDIRATTHLQVPRILLWPSPRALRTTASVHSLIHLERPRAICFEIQSGDNEVLSARLLLKSASAGLRLHTAEAEVILGDCQVTDKTQPGTICFGTQSLGMMTGVKVPYKLDTDMKEIVVRSETAYETANGSFVCGEMHRLSVQLPLGVNVQDIFKEHSLFSKFAISTAKGVPLRLLDCELEGNNDYSVSTACMEIQGLCAFAKQSVSLVYRVAPRKLDRERARREKKLSMYVDYRCLDEEILSSVQSRLSERLRDSDLWRYHNLLVKHLSNVLREKLTQQDMETVGLLREVSLMPFSEVNWMAALSALPLAQREIAASWLRDWHISNQTISLPNDSDYGNRAFAAPKRRIVIPVEIPPLHVLHTACLSVTEPRPSHPFTVGDMISTQLTIKHTRAWSQQPAALPEKMSFYYELEAPSDTWLVAGQRRALFTVKENESKTFPIMLLPLRAGKLMLPALEITPVWEDQKDGEGGAIGCEVDYESQGMSVEVVPGITSVTLDVVEGENGELRGGIGILEVERKQQGRELVDG